MAILALEAQFFLFGSTFDLNAWKVRKTYN